ncbi:MAG: hypothetical protein HOP29_18415 [Phycisphaerales bacterium]|nr:hypothetical protein [Phycisphaerales bacterium]
MERNRRRFVEHHFGRRAHDPMRYDLILNMHHLTPRSAVESAVAALRACDQDGTRSQRQF